MRRRTSRYVHRHDEVVWRNGWILGDSWRNIWILEYVWRNVYKAFNIPIIVNKIFIIIGIGCSGRKDNATKLIMIGLVFYALMMSLMGMGSCIWMNTEAHVWIWIKLRFGLAGERFPRESQSYMTDLRRVG